MRSGRLRGLVVLAVAGLALLAGSSSRAATLPLEEIPTESALYAALEALATRYGTPSGFLQTRPWTLAAARTFLDDLVRAGCGCQGDPTFERVRREIDVEASLQKPAVRLDAEGRTVEVSPYLRFGYTEDEARSPSVVRDYRVGGSVSAMPRPDLLLFADYYGATYSPEPHGNPIRGSTFSVVEGQEFNLWFDRAFVVWEPGVVTARAGHTWLRWGPGQSGTLGLYDGALALDVVEVRWRLLPRAQLTWFLAWLDALNEHYLAGHRLELRLSPSLSLGFSELARFDGSSQVPQYLIPVVGYNMREKQIAHFSDTSADTQKVLSKNNVMWTADAVWRVRPGLQVYGELVVDDVSFSSQYRPTEIGYQTGARFERRMGARDAAGLRLELTRVFNFTYSTWHHHDFESDGFSLAYPYGADVRVVTAEARWDRGPTWTFTLNGVHALHGEGRIGVPWLPAQGHVDAGELSGVVERTASVSLAAGYHAGRRLHADARIGRSGVRNAGHVAGRSLDGWSGASGLTLRW